MENWICVKCKESASSKCPDQRTVFPTDQLATVISNTIGVDVEVKREDKENGSVALDLVVRHGFYFTIDSEDHKTFMAKEPVDIFFERLEAIKNIPDVEEKLRRAFCHHKWVLMEGTVCKLGCTHVNYEQWKEMERTQDHIYDDHGTVIVDRDAD